MTVVHIEPDHANALVLRYLLDERTDYTLHHAIDGNSGLQLCGELTPDLVLTELHLPDMSAYQILRVLRNDAAMERMPCVVLSGDAVPGSIKRALDAGFDDYWTKPIDVWLLLHRINRILRDVDRPLCRNSRVAHATNSR
jgi:CheY-like chemotaxis protein